MTHPTGFMTTEHQNRQSCEQQSGGLLQTCAITLLMPLLMLTLVLMLWVVFPSQAHAASGVKPPQRVLMIEMAPALCSMYATRAHMRQCLEGYALTVSGLNLGYQRNCIKRRPQRLTPLQMSVVSRVMPDITFRNQAWRRYGTCSPYSKRTYFRQIVRYASNLKLPRELSTGNSYTVAKSRFIKQLTDLNPDLPKSGIDLMCQDDHHRQSVLTEMHICYQGNRYTRCPAVTDNCGSRFIISGGS